MDGSTVISLYFNFPTLYFPYTFISLYFNFPTLISLHCDFPIHKRLSYKIRSNQGHTGSWAGWAIVHPCFGRLESALQFNNACANFASHLIRDFVQKFYRAILPYDYLFILINRMLSKRDLLKFTKLIVALDFKCALWHSNPMFGSFPQCQFCLLS